MRVTVGLSPGMAELYPQKVTDLARPLDPPGTRTEVTEASVR
jgi:hypothetical protein